MIRSTFSRWMQRISHPMTTSRTRGRRRPQPQVAAEIGTLEPRALLNGVVNATFAAGTLTLTGVDDLSQNGVLNGLSDQSIQLIGNGQGLVTVRGLEGTVVNGAAA